MVLVQRTMSCVEHASAGLSDPNVVAGVFRKVLAIQCTDHVAEACEADDELGRQQVLLDPSQEPRLDHRQLRGEPVAAGVRARAQWR